jgi:ADP-heptose:LPS heptosyltransferase
VIGPGIKNQKKWITNKNFLTYKDYQNLDYSDQSKKMLEINNYKIFETIPSLVIKEETLINVEPKINSSQKGIVSFGVDSFELYKMWYEENFAELANQLIKSNLAKKIYLIASPQNQNVVKKIINFSSNNTFVDCSSLNLLQVIKVIKNSDYFVGNNSGPLNLASALGVKAFGLIANAKVSELKNSNIIPVLPKDYKNEFNQDREGMKRLKVKTVFDQIEGNLN